MDLQERIERFRKMTEADPDDELGHLSLGRALAEAGRPQEARPALDRALQLNPSYSKAYEVLADLQVKLGQRESAVRTLRTGINVAHRNGDLVPRETMIKMLTDLGETPPDPAAKPEVEAVSAAEADLVCSRCRRPAKRMDQAPFKGDLGSKVCDNVCQTCWREWVARGTMVINELGLQMSDPQAQQVYDEHMIEFLQLKC